MRKPLEARIQDAMNRIKSFGDLNEEQYGEASARVIARVTHTHEREMAQDALKIKDRKKIKAAKVKEPTSHTPEIDIKMTYIEGGLLVTCVADNKAISFTIAASSLILPADQRRYHHDLQGSLSAYPFANLHEIC